MEWIRDLLPFLGTTAAVVVLLFAVHWIMERGGTRAESRRFRSQLVMLLLSLLALLVVVLVLPISEHLRGQVLALIGILLSASIAIASTTILGNALAGIMLKGVIRNFRTGDFVQCGEHLGRVSERGLLHTEIQTADRDLVTLPNLYMVTHPVRTVHPSGTIVSSTVSLGYDVPRDSVEEVLLRAGARAGLQDPFVRILALGDFSVTYRVAGLLVEVKKLLSAQSSLNGAVMDALHADDIEIVSPTFRNVRSLPDDRRFISKAKPVARAGKPRLSKSEELAFDKADAAESLDEMRGQVKKIDEEIALLAEELKQTKGESERESLEVARSRLESRKQALGELIAEREEAGKGEG